jgi:hypothetical protein
MLAMVHELDTLDYFILQENKYIIKDILANKDNCKNLNIKNLIDSDSLCKNFEWIEKKYIDNKQDIEFWYYDKTKLNTLYKSVVNRIRETLKSL